MKITIDQDALIRTLADVSRVLAHPYTAFLTKLAEDGRIQKGEVDQLHEEIYRQIDEIPRIVQKGLFGGSG